MTADTRRMRTLLYLILVLCLLIFAPARADFNAGMAAYERGDFTTAMAEWLPLAEAGDAEAQYRVGRLYGRGEGVNEDKAEALVWYELAAGQDHPVATSALGLYSERGWGVPISQQEAFEHYLRAAELGDSVSASIVGELLWFGTGVSEDKAKAVGWFRVAAEYGDPTSQNNLGVAYSEGSGVGQSDEEAFYWFQRSARQGNPLAQGMLAVSYKYGMGVEENPIKAYMWSLIDLRASGWRAYFSFATAWLLTTAEQRKKATRLADAWQSVPEEAK